MSKIGKLDNQVLRRLFILTCLLFAAGGGCSTVSCKYGQPAFSDTGAVADAARSQDPCADDIGQKEEIPSLLSDRH